MKQKNIEPGKVRFEADGWTSFSEKLNHLLPSKVFILVDENTHLHCLPYFMENYLYGASPHLITIAAGETNKNIASCLLVWERLSAEGADRNSVLINLGGGMVTDLGGFVAATYRRGISFINVPTTLLGMVDASVGGKNGVDLGSLKNQIGIILEPEMVLVDFHFLETLPRQHCLAGWAEMLKHGLIHSTTYWEKIKQVPNFQAPSFNHLIRESINIKRDIVLKDPSEKNIRKTLNYGHTLGHAIESYFLDHKDKKALLHGEAIAIGLILESYLSMELFGFPRRSLEDIAGTILPLFTKHSFDQNDIEAIMALMLFDKKNRDGEVRFVLLEEIGSPRIDCIVKNELIYKAFDYYKNF